MEACDSSRGHASARSGSESVARLLWSLHRQASYEPFGDPAGASEGAPPGECFSRVALTHGQRRSAGIAYAIGAGSRIDESAPRATERKLGLSAGEFRFGPSASKTSATSRTDGYADSARSQVGTHRRQCSSSNEGRAGGEGGSVLWMSSVVEESHPLRDVLSHRSGLPTVLATRWRWLAGPCVPPACVSAGVLEYHDATGLGVLTRLERLRVRDVLQRDPTRGRSVHRAGTVPTLPSTRRQRTIVSPCSVRHPNTSSSTSRNAPGAPISRTRVGSGSTT
jgi:hypothetical protein